MNRDDTNIETVKENLSKTEDSSQLQRLLESEERYRTLFETMVLGVVYQDINGKIISVNPAAEEILGLSIDQMEGRTSTDPKWKSIHKDGSNFPGETHPAMVALKTGKKVKNVVMGVFDPKKEETRWININATPQYKKDETKPFQVYTTFEDITKRLEAEESLNKSEHRYYQLFGSMNEGVALHEIIYNSSHDAVDYIITDINQAYEKILGLKRNEVVGKKASELYGTGNPPYMEIYVTVAEKCEPTEFETYFKPMDKYFRISVVSPEKGKFATVFEDITEHKKSEIRRQELLEKEQQLTQELQKSNEELKVTNEELKYQREELIHLNHAILKSEKRMDRSQEIAHLGSWELDIDNNYLSWSDEVYRIFGLQPQEFDATYDAFLDYVHPDDREAVDEAYSGSVRDGQDTYEVEHRIVRKSTGEVRIVYEKCEHFRNGKGRIVRSVGMVQDITERIKAEDKTKRILESIAESYVEYDNEWRYVDVNTKSEELLGVNKDKLVNKIIWELFPQLIGTKHYNELHRAKKENIHVRFETKSLISKNWYEINAYPHPEGLSVYSHNINERKKAEEALVVSEKHYRELFNSMTEMFQVIELIYDTKGKPIDYFYRNVNPAFEKLVGKAQDQLVDKRVKDIFGIVEDYWLEHYDKVAKTGNPLQFENYGAELDKWYEVNVWKVKENQVAIIFTDITERKLLEEKLKAARDNLEEKVEERTAKLELASIYNRSLIEASIDPLVTIGPDGKITDVNIATENVTGYNRNELIGTDFSDYFTEPERAREGYKKVFKDGLVLNYPLEIKNRNGHITPVLYNASVYKDESGEIIGVFAAARDVTQIKKAEQKLKEYQDTLEEKVENRTKELARSNAELEHFAYIASHDLREPLRMITSFLQLLERRYKDQLDQDANDFIGYAVEGAKRLNEMINDLLEYSKLTSREPILVPLNLEKVLDDVLINLVIYTEEKNAIIDYDPLPTVNGDEKLLIILLQNLIANGIKYNDKKPPKIHISSKKEDDKYIISVKDNGIGIKPEHLERIFTIFQRLHGVEEYEGTGIGLAIAQKIVHAHHGEIWVESELGKGSTFYFTIPING
jgi:PAS domain S-box-containing protein